MLCISNIFNDILSVLVILIRKVFIFLIIKFKGDGSPCPDIFLLKNSILKLT